MNSQMKSPTVMLCILIVLFTSSLIAQEIEDKSEMNAITIEDCYEWSRDNYPLIKQLNIIDKSAQYSLSNASNGNLPQININGQATYQSAVTKLPISIPNMEVPSIDKDQYKIYGEVYQPLTAFSSVNTSKKLIEHESEIEKQKVEVDLYKLKDRINQLYFGVLLIKEKIQQYEIIKSDIDSTLLKVEAAITNGIATITDRQLLSVERISIDQQIEENRANKSAFLDIISTLTKKNITENSTFVIPVSNKLPTTINRPELQLFNLQSQSVNLQEEQLNNSLRPNVGLFVQGGYGRPALNFLINDFDFYYIGGIKFNWNISSLYNLKSTKESLRLVNDRISTQKETFLLNTSLTQSQQSAEIAKFYILIKSDRAIIKVREEILNTAKVQLSNGLITTIDYVKILNDVKRAKQTLLLHETQLLLSQYNLKATIGN